MIEKCSLKFLYVSAYFLIYHISKNKLTDIFKSIIICTVKGKGSLKTEGKVF